jgi:hypothetical protein
MKRIFILMSAMLLLFSGCEKETAEGKRYEVERLLDDGKFSEALDELKDCGDGSFSDDECHLNRGVAYFGLADYDLIYMGEDLYDAYSDDANESVQSRNVMSIIIDRFKNEEIEQGIAEFKTVLTLNNHTSLDCNQHQFKNLSIYPQQSCLAINPILLLEMLDSESSDDLKSVDLEDIIAMERTVRGVIPNISSDDMASILSGDTSSVEPRSQFELDVTECIINKDTAPEVCSESQLSIPQYISDYNEYKIWRVSNSNFTTLKLTIDSEGRDAIALVKEDSYINSNGASCSSSDYHSSYDGSCFPEPTNDTLASKSVDKLNSDEEFLNSVAMMVNVGDDEKSSDEQVESFKTDVCGSSDCNFTESNLVNYFRGN